MQIDRRFLEGDVNTVALRCPIILGRDRDVVW